MGWSTARPPRQFDQAAQSSGVAVLLSPQSSACAKIGGAQAAAAAALGDLPVGASDLMHVMLDTSRSAIAQLMSRPPRSVARSGHLIQFDRADAVIQAFEQLLLAAT
jgi:hypothetical protein